MRASLKPGKQPRASHAPQAQQVYALTTLTAPKLASTGCALQGAATTVYAATAPELESQSGAFLSDCRVMTPSKAAQDGELAKRLWVKTEELIEAALKKGAGGAS
jgi:hypothetical protein